MVKDPYFGFSNIAKGMYISESISNVLWIPERISNFQLHTNKHLT